MLFWMVFLGSIVFAYVMGLVFGYHLRQNTKEGTPSASTNIPSPKLLVELESHMVEFHTVSHPTNDEDIRGIYEFLSWHFARRGMDSACFHFLEVLYNEAESKQGLVHSIVDNLGGVDYEGNPTSELNYLQRIRILREVEQKAPSMAQEARQDNAE